MRKSVASAFAVLLVLAAVQAEGRPRRQRRSPARPKPTRADVAYGKHERNKLDFWQAKSSKPTPLLVFFHGGGFRRGDKSTIHYKIPVNEYLSKSVSCASVNYPFLQHTGQNYLAIMRECESAIDFLREHASEWNIDTKRVAASGPSAGAIISEWLGCTTGHISVIGAFQQPKGTSILVLPFFGRRCPPVIIYQASPTSDRVHHPDNAKLLKATCDRKKVECVVWGTGKNGIPRPPNGKNDKQVMMEFFFKHWGMEN